MERPFISSRGLAAFADRLTLRDPRGRTRRPSLRPAPGGLWVEGPFQLRLRGTVNRARGVRFADATGDPNPIHREGEVVPGAFLAAWALSALEVPCPRLRPVRLQASFTQVCWYGRPVTLTVQARPTPDGLEAQASAWQDGREVLRAELGAVTASDEPTLELPLRRVDAAWLLRVVEAYAALGVAAEAWFHKARGADLSYPAAFLASLPSGGMVRRFAGQGGLLNRLSLEFEPTPLPLHGPPEVCLEPTGRLRRSFQRIATRVVEGVRTAVRGTALVLPQAPPDLLQPRPAGT